jgi:hypothetical protein
MVALPETFAPQDVPEDDRNFEPLPVGQYKVQIIESKIEDTKSGSGQMLTLTLEVTEGEYANRRVWDRLNIRNDNPDAQRIAQRALANLCLAIGVAQLRDTEELHFKPMMVKIGIRQDKTGQYGPQNTVRYTAGKGALGAAAQPQNRPPQAQGRPAQAARPAQGQPAGNKPWNQPKQPQKADLDDEIPF